MSLFLSFFISLKESIKFKHKDLIDGIQVVRATVISKHSQ